MKKDKMTIVIIITTIIMVLIIAFALILGLSKKPSQEGFEQIPEENLNLASYILYLDDKGLTIADLENTVIKNIPDVTGLYTDENLEEYLYVKDKAVYNYTIKEEKEVVEGVEEVSYKLTETEIFKADKTIQSLVYNKDYIIYLTGKTKFVYDEVETEVVETNPLTEQKQEYGEYAYDINIFNRKENTITTIGRFDLDDIDIVDDTIYFSAGNMLNSYVISEDKFDNVYYGKTITNIMTNNNCLMLFSNFGNKDKKTYIFQIHNNLIEKQNKYNGLSLVPIYSTEKESLTYIELDSKPVLFNLNMNGDRETNEKLNLNVNFGKDVEIVYTKDNVVYSSGYVYTTVNNGIDIIDMNTATVYKHIDVNAKTIYPIFNLVNTAEE